MYYNDKPYKERASIKGVIVIILLLSALFFGLSLDHLTVQSLLTWYNSHPFLAIMLIGEIFSYKVVISCK